MSFWHCFQDKKIDFKLKYVIKDVGKTPINRPLFSSGILKFDTGADITIFHASQVGLTHISESDFTIWLQKNEKVRSLRAGKLYTKTLFGFTNSGVDVIAAPIYSYAYQVTDFDIVLDNGILHLGSVPITVTFDDRFSGPLMGKDLISLINANINNDAHRLELDYTQWKKQQSSNVLIDGIYMMKNKYYDIDNLFNSSSVNNKDYKIETRVVHKYKGGYCIEVDGTKEQFSNNDIRRDALGFYYVIIKDIRYNLDMKHII